MPKACDMSKICRCSVGRFYVVGGGLLVCFLWLPAGILYAVQQALVVIYFSAASVC